MAIKPPIRPLLLSHEFTSGTSATEGQDSVALERSGRDLLESHPHFHGRSRWVQLSCRDRQLRLWGRVPSFYLKQLAQEAVRSLPGIRGIVNDIEVINPSGASYAAGK